MQEWGIDVIASPDGLGLEEPRIKVEVKHRAQTAMGAQDVRTFLSILRPGDRAYTSAPAALAKKLVTKRRGLLTQQT